MKSIKSISSTLLADEAIKRGIKIDHINFYQTGMAFLELSYKNHFKYILNQKSSETSTTASYAVENKALAKSLLGRKNINVAKGKLFNKDCDNNEIYKFINRIKYPIVIKPVNGAHGDSVFIGLKNKKDCEEVIKKIFKKNNYVLIEKEFKGEEYRIIASRNKFIAATNRIPANVIGDGTNTIKKLIKIKNNNPLRGGKNSFWEGKPWVKIKIDNIVKNNLKRNGLKLSSIVSKGKRIYLRNNSNLSTGGDSIDVTDQIHSDFKEIAIKAVRAIPGLTYAGLDLMTNKNISEKPTKTSYIVIEMNASPGISMQHFPYQGKPRNVAKGIIDILFPETKGKYIGK